MAPKTYLRRDCAGQLKDFAYNTQGHVIAFDWQERQESMMIYSRLPTSISLANHLNAIVGADASPEGDENDVAELRAHFQEENHPFDFTDRELGHQSSHIDDSTRFLIVGLALPPLPEYKILPSPTSKKQIPVGLEHPPVEDIISPQHDDEPMIVGTPIRDDSCSGTSATKLFVLLHERDGLYTPFTITQDKVFYFDEFRDENKSAKSRGRAWQERVKATVQRSVIKASSAVDLTTAWAERSIFESLSDAEDHDDFE